MKRTKLTTKLLVRRETLRQLATAALAEVAGGEQSARDCIGGSRGSDCVGGPAPLTESRGGDCVS
jgi:hypothetical protein